MILSNFLHSFRNRFLDRNSGSELDSLDLLSSSFIQNPYPIYQWLRENDPVHRVKSGAWLITRYEDIVNALANPFLLNSPSPYSVLSSRNRERYVCSHVANNILPFLDKPKHGEARKVLNSAFGQLLVQSEIDSRAIAQSILNLTMQTDSNKNSLEVLDDFASPFALSVMKSYFGITHHDHSALKSWTNDFFYLFTQIPNSDTRDSLDVSLNEFRQFFLESLNSDSSGSTFLSLISEIDSNESLLSREELLDNCMLFFADGIENVDSGIANMMYLLCRFPDYQQLLSEKPEHIPAFVNECLRFESPAQYIGRIAAKDMEIAGTKVRQNTPLVLALASANRDERIFSQPDQFDPLRGSNPLLSFGRGRHSCIGASLVRNQLEVALRVLLDYSSNWRLSPRFHESEEIWEHRAGHRWLKSLPVVADHLDTEL